MTALYWYYIDTQQQIKIFSVSISYKSLPIDKSILKIAINDIQKSVFVNL